MALLFLLVATMVSSVLLAVANTASRNIVYDKKEQQAMLSVSSIGEYIRNEIASYEFQTETVSSTDKSRNKGLTCTTTKHCAFDPLMDQIRDYAINELQDNQFKKFNDTGYIQFRINMADSMGSRVNALQDLYKLSSEDFGDIIVTVNVANAEYQDNQGVGNIDVGIETLDITLELQGPVKAGNSDECYKMSVYMKCNVLTNRNVEVEERGDSDIVTETITTTYFWAEGIVERGID